MEMKEGHYLTLSLVTSIGAINAAVLVSHVVENKTWKGSSEKLVEFWKYLSCPTPDITKSLLTGKKT